MESRATIKTTVCLLLIAALAAGGCRTTAITAVPDPLWHLDAAGTALWRLRLDGVDYVFTGGIPGPATDVRQPTPFFLVPAYAYDAKILLLRLDTDRVSIRVSGVAFADEPEMKISEPRIYRFVPAAGRKWTLEAISAPFPATVTPAEILRLLGASLNREVVEKR